MISMPAIISLMLQVAAAISGLLMARTPKINSPIMQLVAMALNAKLNAGPSKGSFNENASVGLSRAWAIRRDFSGCMGVLSATSF